MQSSIKIVSNKYFLAVLSAPLFLLAWEPIGITPLIFIAMVPLLHLHHISYKLGGWRYFAHLYFAFLLINIFITWWVWNSTAWGAVTMLVLNSLFMTFPWMLFRFLHKIHSYRLALIGLVLFWISYEHVHHRWDLSWPWLSFGNVFSGLPSFVQWYEFTGIFGGTLLVLLINIFLYTGIRQRNSFYFYLSSGVLTILFAWSAFLSNPARFPATGNINITCLQPNYDAYTEKFTLPPSQMMREMLQLSDSSITDSTEIMLWPETALVDNIDIDEPMIDYQIQMLRNWKSKHPKLSLFVGADGQKIYQNTIKKPEPAARKYSSSHSNLWYVLYNSSFMLSGDSVSQYHKSKLVPGTEIMPFISYLPFLEELAVGLDENSTTGTLGTSNNYNPINFEQHSLVPAICYESIYGQHLARFVRNGAQFIAIITNDAWWGNTPGYKQHFSYARLRAIENRKWVARSANTGISGFINSKGEVVQQSEYDTKTALSQRIEINETSTFYTRHGDFIGRAALFSALLLLILLPTGRIPK